MIRFSDSVVCRARRRYHRHSSLDGGQDSENNGSVTSVPEYHYEDRRGKECEGDAVECGPLVFQKIPRILHAAPNIEISFLNKW